MSTLNKTWIITAFDPFQGRNDNFSETVLKELSIMLNSAPIVGYDFVTQVIPTVYDEAANAVLEKIEALSAQDITIDGVLSLGECQDKLRIETIATNLQDSDVLDNANIQRKNIIINHSAPPQLKLSLPVEFFNSTEDIMPATAISTDAGRFVCNRLCFDLSLALQNTNTYFGFIHVPRPDSEKNLHKPSALDISKLIYHAFKRNLK